MKQKKIVSLRQINCKLLEIIPRNLHYHNSKIKQIFYCHENAFHMYEVDGRS
jgi:hypothetical protein